VLCVARVTRSLLYIAGACLVVLAAMVGVSEKVKAEHCVTSLEACYRTGLLSGAIMGLCVVCFFWCFVLTIFTVKDSNNEQKNTTETRVYRADD